MVRDGGTDHEGSHRKGINITLFCQAVGSLAPELLREPFRGHISEASRFIGEEVETPEPSSDPKLSNTRPAALSDQDVVLDSVRHQFVGSLIP